MPQLKVAAVELKVAAAELKVAAAELKVAAAGELKVAAAELKVAAAELIAHPPQVAVLRRWRCPSAVWLLGGCNPCLHRW